MIPMYFPLESSLPDIFDDFNQAILVPIQLIIIHINRLQQNNSLLRFNLIICQDFCIRKYMKQLVCINIGGAGLKVGQKIWQDFTRQHHIDNQGNLSHQQTIYNHKTIFSQSSLGKYTPRNIFIDTDREGMDQIRKCARKKLYNSKYFISGRQDASNIYSRGGRFSSELMSQNQQIIYNIIEQCDSFQGIIINSALAGGTGSSLTALLLQRLKNRGILRKKTVILNTIASSPQISDTIVEPYNVVMGLGQIIDANNDQQSMCLIYDNQQLYKHSQKNNIENASYNEINSYVSKVTSILTNNLRTKPNDFTLSDIITNIVPYPRTCFISPSLSTSTEYITEDNLITQLYEPASHLNSYSVQNQKIMGSYATFRGQMNNYELLRQLHKRVNNEAHVQWCPRRIKMNLSDKQARKSSSQNLVEGLLLKNSSGISRMLQLINGKYDRLYQKRAFVHWYSGQGYGDQTFRYTRQGTAALERDYQQQCQQHDFSQSLEQFG